MIPLAEAACELPWLAPCASSLVALTRAAGGPSWPALRRDPGLVLLLVRQAPAISATAALSFYSSLLHEPGLLQLAGECLALPEDAFVDWNQPAVRPVYRAALAYAHTAEALALHSERGDPQHAWVSGLLAPLGWLAGAAVAKRGFADLEAAGDAHAAAKWQQRQWGLDQAAIARRLAAAWRLPSWLTAIVGYLGLPLDAAHALGADPDNFLVTQLAVALVEASGRGLRLGVGATREQLMSALDLTPTAIRELGEHTLDEAPLRAWQSPAAVPLLPELLRLAADNRRLTAVPIRQRLHADLDALHDAARRQHAGEEARLHERKLRGLAELAAGAGHEINNPLAVISGQAQYLLISEQESARRKALQTIVGQTQRIHQTLTQLMQFARPPAAHLQRVDLGGLLREVADALRQQADERQVRLSLTEPAVLTLLVDPALMRTALTALVRNGLEAAPASGWVRVGAEHDLANGLKVVVEDSGPGPSALDREHLFDPFYSGRKAGRGRGLGLSTAWQLARQHGGDVSLASTDPTRFVLTLPAETFAQLPEIVARAS